MEQNTLTNSDRAFTTAELQEAGASDEFISLYLSAVDSGVKDELNDGYGGTVLERGDDPTDVAGGWFTKMWNGQLFWALCHADSRNRAAMVEVFDEAQFVKDAVDNENEPLDYAQKMVSEKV